jgi:methionyl-tRNA synthetase
VLVNLAEAIRVVAILTKPFLPKTSEQFYSAFNFRAAQPWERVSFADVIDRPGPIELEVTAPLLNGKPAPLFPRVGSKAMD